MSSSPLKITISSYSSFFICNSVTWQSTCHLVCHSQYNWYSTHFTARVIKSLGHAVNILHFRIVANSKYCISCWLLSAYQLMLDDCYINQLARSTGRYNFAFSSCHLIVNRIDTLLINQLKHHQNFLCLRLCYAVNRRYTDAIGTNLRSTSRLIEQLILSAPSLL